MTTMLNTIAQGLLIGGLYALFAAGLGLVFGIMRIVNIAHGDLIVLGSFIGLALSTTFAIPPAMLFLVVPPTMALIGYVLQRTLLQKTMGSSVLPPLLVTFGISIIIQNGLLQLFSADSRKLSFGVFETKSIEVFPGFVVGWFSLVVFVAAVGTIAGLKLLIDRTSLGTSFRASADDAEVAALVGIDTQRVFGIVMALAMAVAGLASIFLSGWTSITPLSGPGRLLVAFEVVVIGGIGSIWGILLGGLVLGLAQAVGGWVDPGWSTLAGHLAFLAILLFRPTGILSSRGSA